MKTPKQIQAMKEELRALVLHGYKHGGSIAHGDKVRKLKAEIEVAKEERKFFGTNPKRKTAKRAKPRTAAQKAATARMLAGLRAKRGTGAKRISAAAVRAAHRAAPKRKLPRKASKLQIATFSAPYKVVSGKWGGIDKKIIARFKEKKDAFEYAQAKHAIAPAGTIITVET